MITKLKNEYSELNPIWLIICYFVGSMHTLPFICESVDCSIVIMLLCVITVMLSKISIHKTTYLCIAFFLTAPFIMQLLGMIWKILY